MPTYGYRCASCGTEFDVRQRMSDPAGAECPKCGQPARRVFFAPAIVFNGSGFYKTDSRSTARAGGSKAKSSKTPATPAASSASGASGADTGSGATATSSSSTPAPSTD